MRIPVGSLRLVSIAWVVVRHVKKYVDGVHHILHIDAAVGISVGGSKVEHLILIAVERIEDGCLKVIDIDASDKIGIALSE